MGMSEEIKKEIAVIFKSEGMDMVEEAAVMAVKAAFKIIKLVVPKVSAGLGAIVVPMVDLVEPKILEMLDKIDGEDDPGR